MALFILLDESVVQHGHVDEHILPVAEEGDGQKASSTVGETRTNTVMEKSMLGLVNLNIDMIDLTIYGHEWPCTAEWGWARFLGFRGPW